MIEKFRRKTVFVGAEQWFPGQKIEGLSGDDPHKWCGCVILGGPCDRPHIHIGLSAYLLSPGDWVITESNGKRRVCSQEDFDKEYESAEMTIPMHCPSCGIEYAIHIEENAAVVESPKDSDAN